MTDRPDGGREPWDDAQPIPQRRRAAGAPRPGSPSVRPAPGPGQRQPESPTQALPTGRTWPQPPPRRLDPEASPTATRGYAAPSPTATRGYAAPSWPADSRPAAQRPAAPPLAAPRRAAPPPEAPRPAAPPLAARPAAPRPAAPPPAAPPPPGAGEPGREVGPRGAGRPPHTARRIVAFLALAVLVWGVATAAAVSATWSAVGRVDAEPAVGHIADTAGRNVLMVGSDGRANLSAAERKKLGTGFAEGARTDSIMILHTGSGDPTLVSIPRDSYVEIPGHGMNKINAAFALGGPALLAETVEKATGLALDGYLEIGFGGFAELVDSVGGVRMCLPTAISDEKAHIDLPAGCQVLDGTNSLGYVRARYFDPLGDLGRVQRQRAFLGALMGKLATPANVLLPWRLHTVGTAGASAITVGTDDGLYGTAKAFQGLRAIASDNGASVTVPVADAGLQTGAGLAVQWDGAAAEALFASLRK